MQASRRCSAFGRLVGWEYGCPLRRRRSYLPSLCPLWGSPVPLGRAVPLPQLPSVWEADHRDLLLLVQSCAGTRAPRCRIGRARPRFVASSYAVTSRVGPSVAVLGYGEVRPKAPSSRLWPSTKASSGTWGEFLALRRCPSPELPGLGVPPVGNGAVIRDGPHRVLSGASCFGEQMLLETAVLCQGSRV